MSKIERRDISYLLIHSPVDCSEGRSFPQVSHVVIGAEACRPSSEALPRCASMSRVSGAAAWTVSGDKWIASIADRGFPCCVTTLCPKNYLNDTIDMKFEIRSIL